MAGAEAIPALSARTGLTGRTAFAGHEFGPTAGGHENGSLGNRQSLPFQSTELGLDL